MLNNSAALDRTFRALGDPTRRDILARLAQRPTSVSELARPLAMSLPAVMQHLAVLESSGLVRTEKLGRVRTYSIEPQTLSLAQQWISQQRLEWEQRFDRLGEFLHSAHAINKGDPK